MNLWALCGMGYTLGQFFQLKYVDLNFLIECGRHTVTVTVTFKVTVTVTVQREDISGMW